MARRKVLAPNGEEFNFRNARDFDGYWDWPDSPYKSYAHWVKEMNDRLLSISEQMPVYKAKREQRRQPSGKIQCRWCRKEFDDKDIIVERIHPIPQLRKATQLGWWVRGLMCVSFDDLQCVCPTCKRIYDVSVEYDVTFEKAKVVFEAEAMVSGKKDKEWLVSRGIHPERNMKERRHQVLKEMLK